MTDRCSTLDSSPALALEPLSIGSFERLRHALKQATSSLDMYRSAAVLLLINETRPLRFGWLSSSLVVQARGFLGLPDRSPCWLEPQGRFGDQEAALLLEVVRRAREPIYFACISQSFLERNASFVAHFEVKETPDLAEYVFDLREQSAFAGRVHSSRRGDATHFERESKPRLVPIDSSNLAQCKEVQATWLTSRLAGAEDEDRRALQEDTRATDFSFAHFEELGFFGWLLVVDQRPLGYMICERITEKVAAWRVGRVLRGRRGAQVYLDREVSRKLVALGFDYANWDIDGGVAGVRARKVHARRCRIEPAFSLGPR